MGDDIEVFIKNIDEIKQSDSFELCMYHQHKYELNKRGNINHIDKNKCVLIMENSTHNIQLFFISKIKNRYYLLLSVMSHLIWIKYNYSSKKITTAYKMVEEIDLKQIVEFIETNLNIFDEILEKNNAKFLGNCLL